MIRGVLFRHWDLHVAVGISHEMNAFCCVFFVGRRFHTPSIWPESNVAWFLETKVRCVLTGKNEFTCVLELLTMGILFHISESCEACVDQSMESTCTWLDDMSCSGDDLIGEACSCRLGIEGTLKSIERKCKDKRVS